MNHVAAVVVTYNRKDLLCEAIAALQASEYPCDILIIDNASTDGTYEAIEKLLSMDENRGTYYFNTGANLGGAGGFQYGVRKAYEKGYEDFWLMDDDTIVKPDSLSVLMEAKQKVKGEYGWLSSLALWTDGTACTMNFHEVAKDWNVHKMLTLEGLIKGNRCTFVSCMVSRKAVKQSGLPIKEYFIWGDDTEYTGRIAKEFPCYIVLASQVVHKMKNNIPSMGIPETDDVGRIDRFFYSTRNDLCTFRRNGFKQAIQSYLNAWRMFFKVLRSHGPYKGRKLRVIVKGIWAGMFFHPKIEKVE